MRVDEAKKVYQDRGKAKAVVSVYTDDESVGCKIMEVYVRIQKRHDERHKKNPN